MWPLACYVVMWCLVSLHNSDRENQKQPKKQKPKTIKKTSKKTRAHKKTKKRKQHIWAFVRFMSYIYMYMISAVWHGARWPDMRRGIYIQLATHRSARRWSGLLLCVQVCVICMDMDMCCMPPVSYVRFVWVWRVSLWCADNNDKRLFEFLLDLRFDKKTG